MRWFRLALVALAAIISSLGFVPSVSAESYVIDDGPPKGVVGHDGIRCIGEASGGGHSFKMVMYVGADADEPADKEHAWQATYCREHMTTAMIRWAATPYNGEYCLLWNPGARNPGVDEPADLYCYRKPSVGLDPGSIKVTIQRV